MGAPTSTVRVMMARQPILDRRRRIVAYELLYRQAEGPLTGPLDEARSAQSLLNAVAEIGLERLAGPHLAYFNVSPGLLHDPALYLLPPHRVVLELLEDARADAGTITMVESLREQGYSIALDDFVFLDDQVALLPYVDMIKVDVLAVDHKRLRREMSTLKSRVPQLLAEKVEDAETFRSMSALGFHYFQGYFFAKPENLEATSLNPNRMALMRVLAEVYRPNAKPSDIEDAIAGDPGLAVRLLRLVNSASMALPRRIESLRAAIAFLGTRRIQAIAVLLVASARSTASPALGSLALSRARTCEEIARREGWDDPAKHFTVGLLSVLDGMLDMPMNTLVEQLPLSMEISSALRDPLGRSPAAQAIALVLLLERGEWDEIIARGYDPTVLTLVMAGVVDGNITDLSLSQAA